MRCSLVLAALAPVVSVYAGNIPVQRDNTILSSLTSEAPGAISTETSAAASAFRQATSALPSVTSDIDSAAAGAFDTATSDLAGAAGDATSALGGAAGAAASKAANGINGLIGAGVGTHATGGMLSLGVCVGIAMVLL